MPLETLKRNWMQLNEENWIHAMPCDLVELLYRNKQRNRSCAFERSKWPIAGKMDKTKFEKHHHLAGSSTVLRSRSVSKLLTLALYENACPGDRDTNIYKHYNAGHSIWSNELRKCWTTRGIKIYPADLVFLSIQSLQVCGLRHVDSCRVLNPS